MLQPLVLHPSPCALLQGVGVGAGGGQDSSTGALKPPALVATLLVSLHQSDPLGLNATPLPQDSSLVETPLAENKPRKRQLSEEQPSGNGVKKPKVSVSGLGRAGSWQGPFSPLSYFPPSLPSFFLPTPSLLLPLFYSSFLPSPPFSPLLPFSLLAFFPSLLCPWILSSVYMSSIFIYMRIISKFLSLVDFPQNSRSCLSTLHLYLDVLDSESTCAKLT